MPSFPSTAATTGPSTAEAGAILVTIEAGPQQPNYTGYGVVLCRRPTHNGVHVLTTWLCAAVKHDFHQAHSKYVVLCPVGAQIIIRCEPFAGHAVTHVFVTATGTTWNVDDVYHLTRPRPTGAPWGRSRAVRDSARVCRVRHNPCPQLRWRASDAAFDVSPR